MIASPPQAKRPTRTGKPLTGTAGVTSKYLRGTMNQHTPHSLAIEGLSQPLQLWRDAWGIPHIKANNEQDVFIGLGYAHAQDRLWQMDLLRRRGYGRWAEGRGCEAIEADRLARRLGGESAARRDYDALGKDARAMPHRYTLRHNAFIPLAQYPTQHPLRELEVPSMYTQAHIACDTFDAIGLTVPGVPAFPHVAHNGHVAWCVTHAFVDIHDLYIERFRDLGRQSLFRDQWEAVKRRIERIHVRGSESVDVEVLETRHGPVIAGDPASGTALVLRSVQFVESDVSFACLPL